VFVELPGVAVLGVVVLVAPAVPDVFVADPPADGAADVPFAAVRCFFDLWRVLFFVCPVVVAVVLVELAAGPPAPPGVCANAGKAIASENAPASRSVFRMMSSRTAGCVARPHLRPLQQQAAI
jgi:hypothetical protein